MSTPAFRDVDPEITGEMTDAELKQFDEDTHRIFGEQFSGAEGDVPAAGRLSREDLLNAHVFVIEEMVTRGMQHREGKDLDQLDRETIRLAPEIAQHVYGIHAIEHIHSQPVGSPLPGVADGTIVSKAGPSGTYADIRPGSEGAYPVLKLDEVEPLFKDFVLRDGAVVMVGSICNNGQTHNDVDLLVKGPLDDETRHVIEFRLGRMLPPEISKRVQFHGRPGEATANAGPYTAHVPLYDIVLRRRADRSVVEMRDVEKQDEPHMILTDKEEPRPAIFQTHVRGASIHGDFRIQVGKDFLVGWTLSLQRAGKVPHFEGKEDLERVKKFVSTFDQDGTVWNKPLIAPFHVFATGKAVQPVVWREIQAEAFPPGSVGATRSTWGYIVAIAHPQVTQGVQKSYFHEYFVEDDPKFGGLLSFRLLTGKPGELTEEIDAGRRAAAGEAFWTAQFNKSLVPSVLKDRAVEVNTLPPPGRSCLPAGIREAIPKEYRYWEASSPKEVMRIRNELVAAKIVTDETVRFEGNKFVLAANAKKAFSFGTPVVKKGRLFAVRGLVTVPLDRAPESLDRTKKPAGFLVYAENPDKLQLKAERVPDRDRAVRRAKVLAGSGRAFVAEGVGYAGEDEIYETIEVFEAQKKALETLDYALTWQQWKGQIVIRAAPTKQLYHLFLKRGDSVVEDFQILADPTQKLKQATAIRRELTGVDASKLLAFEGPADPGKSVAGIVLNPSKNTPSSLTRIDGGKVELLDDQRTFKKLRFKSGPLAEVAPDGIFVLIAEQAEGDIWILEQSAQPSRPIPELVKSVSSSCGIEVAKTFTVTHGVQVWDPKDVKPTDDKGGDRKLLAPPALYAPMKPAPRSTNRFTDVVALVSQLQKDKALLQTGLAVEGKFNGFHVSVQKWEADGKPRSWIFTEEAINRHDAQTNLLDKMPSVKKELESIPGSFIMDCEFLAVDEHDEPVSRADLAVFRSTAGGAVDDSGVQLCSFQLLYRNGENLTALPYSEMRKHLEAFFKDHEFEHLVLSPIVGVAHNTGDVEKLVREASRLPASEGAMLKSLESTYSLGGENDGWLKVKVTRTLSAVVLERHDVKGSPGVYNFTGGLGPVSQIEAKQWKETRELNGKTYVFVGVTGNKKLEAKVGDTIAVDFLELAYYPGPPKRIRWFGPAQAISVIEAAPSRPADALALLDPGEEKTEKDDRIDSLLETVEKRRITFHKQEDAPERYVLGVVLEPEVADSQGDIYSADEVRQAAFRFMEYRQQMGVMHRRPAAEDEIRILESYIAPVDFTLDTEKVRKGTWLLGARIADDDLWAAVERGDFTGWSIGGSAIREPA